MDRVAIFIDAGYFFAQGSIAFTGLKRQRGDLDVDFDKLLSELEAFATKVSGQQLLRIYWYDGTSTGPSAQHTALAYKPRVKVRLGFVNNAGLQKGVDSLIVTDIIRLAMNRAICDAVLLSGDEDLRVGVQQAQEFGVRVHLLGIAPCRGSQSQFLMQEADTTHEWSKNDLLKFLAYTPRPNPPIVQATRPAPKAPTTTTSVAGTPMVTQVEAVAALPTNLSDLAKQAASEIDSNLVNGILDSFQSLKVIPQEVDRPLLGRAKRFFGNLTRDQLKQLRENFVSALKLRSVSSAPTTPK